MGAEDHFLPWHYICRSDAFYSGAFSFANLCDTRCPRLMDSICSKRVLLLSPMYSLTYLSFAIIPRTLSSLLHFTLLILKIFLTHLAPFNFLVLQILPQYHDKLWNMNAIVMVSSLESALHGTKFIKTLMIYKRSRLEGRGVVGFRWNLCRVSRSGESGKTLALTGWRLWQ